MSSASFCNGNYGSGPKVSVFNFPKDTDLRGKWISSNTRKDLKRTSNFNVKKLHVILISDIYEYYLNLINREKFYYLIFRL